MTQFKTQSYLIGVRNCVPQKGSVDTERATIFLDKNLKTYST